MKKTTRENRLRVSLAEYEACLITRNHYDSTRWLIGTIFIALAFTLFGLSFVEPLATRALSVGIIGTGSITLFFFFVYYDQHVTPWLLSSIERSQTIERNLRHEGYDIEHQLSIAYYEPDFKMRRHQRSAFYAVVIMTILLTAMWTLRILVR